MWPKQESGPQFCPIALFDDGSFPTLQAGIEWPLSERFSWYNELGIRYRKSQYDHADTSILAPRGFKAKTELRYYITFRGKTPVYPEGYYLAANLFYAREKHTTGISYYYNGDSTVARRDNFGVRKRSLGLNLLAGRQVVLKGRFLLDLYAGIGIKPRRITTLAKEYESGRDGLITAIDLTIQGIKNEAEAKGGHSIAGNLTAGLRLCLLL
ncbi:MAG: hypothetical protein ABW019_05110 [Chitinophagaceae bacterium]